MRDQIIKYLQGMKCEWFPVEWDSFAANFLGMELSYPSTENIKIKYRFFGTGCYDVLVSEDYLDDQPRIIWNFWTLDRCKTLLLNAVRSVDEPKKIAAGEIINGYEIEIDGSDVRIYTLHGSAPLCRIVWKNGEFK